MSESAGLRLVDPGDKGMIEEIGNAIRGALAEEGKGKWPGTSSTWLGTKAVEAIDDSIGAVDPLDLLGAAWACARDLQDRADPERYPPGKAHYVKLGQHTVGFDVTPQIVVSLAGWSSRPLAIALELSSQVSAMELKIRDGHIVSIHGGTCDVGLTMKIAGQVVMPRRSLRKFTLDAEHRFAEPGWRLSLRPVPAAAPEAAPGQSAPQG